MDCIRRLLEAARMVVQEAAAVAHLDPGKGGPAGTG
jgi:hypothetical protein